MVKHVSRRLPVWTRPGGPRLSLTARFGLISAALAVLLGFVLADSLSAIVDNRARGESERATELLALVTLEPALAGRPESGPLGAEVRSGVDEAVRVGVEQGVLRRIKIFDADGTLVYSDDPEVIGDVYELTGR